jgi:hypothetical protein
VSRDLGDVNGLGGRWRRTRAGSLLLGLGLVLELIVLVLLSVAANGIPCSGAIFKSARFKNYISGTIKPRQFHKKFFQ